MLTYLGESAGLPTPHLPSPRANLLAPPMLLDGEHRRSWSGAHRYVPENYRPFEVPIKACPTDKSTSTIPSGQEIHRSPASDLGPRPAATRPSPMPRSTSSSRSECNISWVVPPRNISLEDPVNWANWKSKHEEEQSTVQYLSPRRTSRGSRGRVSRSPHSSTSREDHRQGRSRSRESRRHAEALPGDYRTQSHQGQAGHRGREHVSDKAANILSAFVLGAWWMARAAR